jgi:NADH-quinone oxidoreductase subunit M
MFSHGVIAGLLFAIVGRMVYDRTHTRDLAKLHPMDLARALPFAAVTFTLAGAASIGLPGFSGFVAELQVLLGAWQAFPTLAVIAGAGILVGVAYTLRALQAAFFAEPASVSVTIKGDSHLAAISLQEKLGCFLLLGASVFVGLYPHALLRWIVPSVAQLIKTGGFP